MGDVASARRARETRQALRELDSARRDVKLGKRLFGLSLLILAGVVTGWVFALRWGLASVGHVDRGGPMTGLIFGLIIASFIAFAAVGLSLMFLSDATSARDKAHGKWEDATWAEVES